MRYNNGEGTQGHDDDKYRDNCDKIDFGVTKRPEYTGKEVAAKDLPSGIRSRIVYGKRDQ